MVRLYPAPGVQLAVAVWDSLDNTPAYATQVEIIERVAGQYAANALRGWLPLMGGELSEPQIEKILRAAEAALRGFVRPNGEIVFDSPAHVITVPKP